jgi:predicted nucleic acid-binding protein
VSVFFDTNVLVYCTDSKEPVKQAQARRLVAQAGADGEAVISTQVLIELFNVLTRKQKMPADTARTMALAYTEWQVVQSDTALVSAAMDKAIQHKLSIWDAMVVEAAVRAGAPILYTEDMTHGQRYGGVTLVNPFLG